MYAQGVIILVGFSGFVGLSLVIPVLPLHASALGASALGATLAFSMAAIVAMFSGLLWWRTSDLVGRKPIIRLSLVGQAGAFLWLALAGSLWEIYAARAVEGFFVGSVPALIASMSDITTEEQRTGAIGRLSAGFTAGFIVGPVLGGVLATAFTATPSYMYPFLFTAALFGVLAVLALFALPESRTSAVRAATAGAKQGVMQRVRFYARPRLAIPLVSVGTVTFASNSTSAIFALWALQRFGWDVGATSWAITAMAALVMGWNLLAGRLKAWLGNARLLLATQGGIALAFLALVYVQSPVVLYLILVLAAFGNGLGRSVSMAAVSLAAEADRRGEAMGVQGMVSSGVTAFGPLLAGWLFVSLSPSAPFAVIAAVAAAVFALHALYLMARPETERV
jgi:MFS family permease